MDYSLNVVCENDVNRYLLCDSKQNYYSINKLLFDILQEYKNTNDVKATHQNLNNRTDNFISLDYIEKSLEKVESIILNNKQPILNNQKYIKHKVTIIKEGQLLKTYSVLSLLFTKYTFVFLSLLSLFISTGFIVKYGLTNLDVLYNKLIGSATPVSLIVAFTFSLCIVLVHEIGHATAAFKFNIKPKEIGAGLYFIFPVFYTNVTNIWKLPAAKRMIVNLGGIYFQLIINVLLIALFSFSFFTQIIPLLFVFNSLSILVSFNPFFRYDGYWLFSDFFNIYNLKEKSKEYVLQAISFPKKLKSQGSFNHTAVPIIIYSILNIAFWTEVYISIVQFLIKNIPISISLVFVKSEFSVKSISSLLSCVLIFLWIFFAIKNIYLNMLKNKYYAK